MKQNHFLVHYDELALKGKNRPFFEKKLADNIVAAGRNSGETVKVQKLWGRFLVSGNDSEKINRILGQVFGIAWFAPVTVCPPDFEAIKKGILTLAAEKKFKTFAVRANVAEKAAGLTRHGLEVDLGSLIVGLKKKVDLENPEKTFFVEVADKKTVFIFAEKTNGLAGLPVGCSGKAVCLISGGIDSPVAAFRMMGRGLKVAFVHCHSYPKTSQDSVEKVKKIVADLSAHQAKTKLYLLPFLDFQKQSLASCRNDFLVILYRRMMLRLATGVAAKIKAEAIITGDVLGQVASQTLANIAVQNQAVDLPILRPLIGCRKQEIIDQAQKIGTYETSIIPQQDCCSLFVPRHPATKANAEEVLREEEKLNIDKLVGKILDSAEIINYPQS